MMVVDDWSINSIVNIIQHLHGSLSFDWRIVGHMIFNRCYIARACIFGYMQTAYLSAVRVSLCVSDAKAI